MLLLGERPWHEIHKASIPPTHLLIDLNAGLRVLYITSNWASVHRRRFWWPAHGPDDCIICFVQNRASLSFSFSLNILKKYPLVSCLDAWTRGPGACSPGARGPEIDADDDADAADAHDVDAADGNNAAENGIGPSWGRFGTILARLDPLGTVLEPSWRGFGAILDVPGTILSHLKCVKAMEHCWFFHMFVHVAVFTDPAFPRCHLG